ncbi:metallopeptidase TldD-related protein [Thermosynechococcus sp. PKX82]|nr:metallopeptidase TldD-related protein [Thermosynechococcus sp. PKX82]WNC30026.1 metallopeptidase TldD-related protein [Thermosynechococcus sp. PKX82]
MRIFTKTLRRMTLDFSAAQHLSHELFAALKPTEALFVEIASESSQFIRFNRARVRQIGTVEDTVVTLRLQSQQRTASTSFPYTGTADLAAALEHLAALRSETVQLPVDPYLVPPTDTGSIQDTYLGRLPDPDSVVETILTPVQGLDFVGIYSGGTIARGSFNSAGQEHWFATETFCLDYSLFTAAGKAVKNSYASTHWDTVIYQAQIEGDRQQLAQLEQPPRQLAAGRYRTYFAPAAVAELVGMLSWGAVSEAAYRQGGSALAKLREGATLSPLFSLQEDFTTGTVPRFNADGDIAPPCLALIDRGKLQTLLISRRTAQEYHLVANGANRQETLRSPLLWPGTLPEQEVLAALDTGLYVGNLHYLNWSDRPNGRMTGMTRYACFWVEQGKIVAPITDLRFDDSLYEFWGDNLEALTDTPLWIAHTDTYERRSLGGITVPGMLVKAFQFTL